METCTVIAVPITTRGLGIHTNGYYNYCAQTLGSNLPCTINQMYRVALLQLDIRLQCCLNASILPFDPDIDVTYSSAYFKEFSKYSMVQTNFNLIAKAVSSVGNFVLNDIAYQPYVPQMTESALQNESDIAETDLFGENRRIIPNPYLITLHNLRSVVTALSNPSTPLHERRQFIQRNPIPGARFDNDLLKNADDIMPDCYDFTIASKDVLDFVALLSLVNANDAIWSIVEPLHYEHPGHISNLVSLHHPNRANFSVYNQQLLYLGQSTVRSYQPMENSDQFHGCVNLMSEYPNTVHTRNNAADLKRWSIRNEYLSMSVYKTDWLSAVKSVMP